ncbi:MAG: hypothetical protein P4L46_09745 [Fimbriimonas sp.]|nr:hypothetical protein [Fimbriimonas sp.]
MKHILLRSSALAAVFVCLGSAQATTYYNYVDLGANFYPLGISPTAGYIVGDSGAVNGTQMVYMKINTANGVTVMPITPVPTSNGVISNIGFANSINDGGTLLGQDQMHIIGYSYTINSSGPTRLLPDPHPQGTYPPNGIFPAAITNGGNTCGFDNDQIPLGCNCWFKNWNYGFPPTPAGTFAGFGAVNDSGLCSAFYGSYTWNAGTNTWTQVAASSPAPSSSGVGTLYLTSSLLGCPYCGMNSYGVNMGTTVNGSGTPIPFRNTSASQLANPYNSGGTVYGAVAYGINNAGFIVGTLTPGTSGMPHAFIAWNNTGTDLNGLVNSLPANTTLEYATAIDNTTVAGQVTGCIIGVSAVVTGTGRLKTTTYHGFVLIPTAVLP